ncbi:MAG: uroporphyrinogen-III C-methyltransferase [Alphaproteobacteria bacterium]|nr:uroporphyrinogen-III C-methyltransferase [Alphaproteobacteria bacterium]MBT4020541.1 uroporphyrinogen-III C-methyltransferase [Alphaproteobacteria bacterium]MBT4967007.1 uroporphyrinogen-III C-methyltransferase [Alphaproteobacteria bacterium]MBT5160525.1 uroporphyrinogen-III C-methyltransferase [Alphaproteobacteria bacterium]MBT5920362.1 uroporphyrinogen-III C-methyltransferase [Alphaproteobacteria bacterium]
MSENPSADPSHDPSHDPSASGTVYLIGAGPGDPDLLTVKAARLLSSADVIVYDRLVSDAVMDLVPSTAPRIYAGKASKNHSMPQPDINALLVTLAQEHKTVVRLKGGDPFIFGRGSEEAIHLAENDVAFQIVPGISAASGCSAYLGVPLTHRGLATGVRYVTGHTQEEELDLDWENLADPDTTLVVYMGLANLGAISDRLIAAGLSPDTPIAAVERGTTPQQRHCISTLKNAVVDVTKAELGPPCLIVIGKVASIAGTLQWWQPGD